MSYHGEHYKTVQLKNEEERKAMIERNQRQMEELAKEQPVPTIEDIQNATAPRKPREEAKPAADDDDNKTKTSVAAPADAAKSGYNTRAQTAKK